MQPSIAGSDRASVNINLRKIETGFQVNYSKEDKKINASGDNFLYDYINDTYAFSTLEEAVAKVSELGGTL